MAGERQIEMVWRCSSCGHENLGRHMVCQGCGSPKDDSEQYEMPGDPSAAASVTDPALLRMAKAGANWRCRYCGSDQRTLAGTCAQCGSAQAEGRSTAEVAPRAVVPTRVLPRRPASLTIVLPIAAGLVFVLGVCGFVSLGSGGRTYQRLAHCTQALTLPFQDEEATVTALAWKQVVAVDRWQILEGEGFEETKPADAFAVRPVGPRFHHNERVPDGYNSESYTETEPDGFRTETYTEQEACGQDCTPRPEICQEKCTPNGNGFATCRNECTGGGQDCHPKYCNVTKTRQVPQTKTVTKTRQVPRYKDEPRNATWYAWKVWGWKLARTLSKSGTSAVTAWPGDDEVSLGKGLAKGERERERRSGDYQVFLRSGEGPRTLTLPNDEALARYSVGSSQRVRVWSNGRVDPL